MWSPRIGQLASLHISRQIIKPSVKGVVVVHFTYIKFDAIIVRRIAKC